MSEVILAPERALPALPTDESMQVLILMQQAIDRGISVDAIGKLAEMQDKTTARRAERDFFRALAAFQQACPTILKGRTSKTATGRGTGFEFTYASFDDVVTQLRPDLTAHGFSITFDQSSDGKLSTVTCHLRHENGHHISNECTVPVDSNLPVGSQQKIGAALQYAKRYALVAMLGVAYGDEQPMTTENEVRYINEEQATTLAALVEELASMKWTGWKKFAGHFGITTIDELRLEQYPQACEILEGLRKKGS